MFSAPLRRAATLAVLAGLGPIACARPYAYDFHLSTPGAELAAKPGAPQTIEDADVRAEVSADAVSGVISLGLTNKTDQVLQVKWSDITLIRGGIGDEKVTNLRPDVDLGWLSPGAIVAARLVTLALPLSGDQAAAYDGQSFTLNVPAVVRHESRRYRYLLTVHVRPL